ncbi:MAG: hypothetical protein IJV16_09130 [Lachnospiraceae bacterium]|nr:hypothetical protein [Lachnospiraceae bacterium]
MAQLIISAIFFLTGIYALTDATEPNAPAVAAICFAIGGVLVYFGIKSIKNPQKPNNTVPVSASVPVKPAAPPAGTYTFQPTGTRFDCLFPIRGFGVRQRVLERSKIGDPVRLQVYEWEGVAAVAVINARIGADLGVVKKDQVSRVVDLITNYNVSGRIIKITDFDMNDKNYLSCEIRLEYYNR